LILGILKKYEKMRNRTTLNGGELETWTLEKKEKKKCKISSIKKSGN
jgi:hypothetical protein